MIRYALRCHGCGEAFSARLGAQPTNGTKFYFPCPHCGLPVRGQIRGHEIEDHVVQFFDCDQISLGDLPVDAVVVTPNPFVPSKYDAGGLEQFGGSGTLVLHRLLRDETLNYFDLDGSAHEVIAEMWPRVRRMYEYYLSENWAMFDKAGDAVFEGWETVATARQRTTIAHRALDRLCRHIVGEPSEAAASFLDRFMRKHLAALKVPAYVGLLQAEEGAGKIAELQRAVFETVDLFIAHFESWSTGRLARHVDPLRQAELNELVLFRDEFGETRDLYQRGFEVTCKTLLFIVAIQNTVKRQDPNDFGEDHPEWVPTSKQPTTLAKYDKISNAYRLAYVARVPGWEGYVGLLDNRIRNNIGHASARHDLRSGKVVNDQEFEGVPYLTFIARVFDVFEALTVALEVLRAARVASSLESRQ